MANKPLKSLQFPGLENTYTVVGETISGGGEIFNDYENNHAFGVHSHAMGSNTIAGTMSYMVASIIEDKENNILTIQLSRKDTHPVFNAFATIDDADKIDISSEYGDYLNTDGTYKYIISIASNKSRYWTNCTSIIGLDAANSAILVSSEGIKSKGDLILSQTDTSCRYYLFTPAEPQKGNYALGGYSIATGHTTQAIGTCSRADGYLTQALSNYSHAEGLRTTAAAQRAHAEGTDTIASGTNAHAEGNLTQATHTSAHAEGVETRASGEGAHSEGVYVEDKETKEKIYTMASGKGSHAEGGGTNAAGNYSHAEGQKTSASGANSHAEGEQSTASGNGSHAEGRLSVASGTNAHAEGFVTKATALGAHSEGRNTIAASECQHVQGRYNIEDANKQYAHIVGNGTSKSLSNAHTLDWYGNAWFAGNVYVGTDNQKLATDNSVDTKLSEYVKNTDYATNDGTTAGVVRVRNNNYSGLYIGNNGELQVYSAGNTDIDNKTSEVKPITPKVLDYAIKRGLADNKSEWDDDEKARARNLLNAVSASEVQTMIETAISKIAIYNGEIEDVNS